MCGSGSVNKSGQHLIAVEEDADRETEERQGKGRGKRMRSEQVCTREDGQLGHTHGELVNFIYWILTFSFWIF